MPAPPTHLCALRAVLRTPAALRPALLLHPVVQSAAFHSTTERLPAADDASAGYRAADAAILSAALRRVPAHGFTEDALVRGARDAGYLSISTNLFPRGVFDLVQYYLVTRRRALRTAVQFADEGDARTAAGSTGQKIRTLVLARLRMNVEAGVVPHWTQALGWMAHAENVGASLAELARLSDDMCFLAADPAVDASWYTRRAALAGVYAAAELFQTADRSTGGRDTEDFVARRLEDVHAVGHAAGDTLEWLAFQGGSMVNVLRSKGMRI